MSGARLRIHPVVALAGCALLLAGCGVRRADNEIVLQRFFGTCLARYGGETRLAAAEGECGIITTLINKFNADNPDIHVKVSTVAWPGYDQLSAQLATGDAPDVVTMHESAISDYQSRGLLEPLDAGLRAAGIDPANFTDASRLGVAKAGQIYGLPFDTWAPLWHINLNYFRKAGLIRNGQPVLPTSPAQLLQQARQFRAATGKPYFVQSLANEPAMYARNLYTFMMQQNAPVFPDPRHIRLRTPEGYRAVEIFRDLYREGLSTRNQDYAAATEGFINGDGGVYLVGTWLIGDFYAESRRTDRPLSNGYTVMPYPQLFSGRNVTYADGHAWVVPVRERTARQRAIVFRLLKFLADNDFDWSRTGHLPAFTPVIDSARFRQLPLRSNIAELAHTGTPLPSGVQRQFSVQAIVCEELAAAVTGQKSIDAALASAELRVNDLLFNVL